MSNNPRGRGGPPLEPRSGRTVYVLVRHSAWTAKRDTTFQRAVEASGIREGSLVALLRVTPLLWAREWGEADVLEQTVNYPPGAEGLIARAEGRFESLTVGRGIYDVYVPTASEALLCPQHDDATR